MKIYFGDIRPDKYSILFLVYEPRAWDEAILTNLNAEFNSSDSSRFEARVVLISQLRELIRNSYKWATNLEMARRLSDNG